jgi:adenylate kinase family enzyme
MIKAIHILGASGSGTTTLGRAISEKFGYTHLDTDDYFWLPTNPPFTMPRETKERQHLLSEDMMKVDKCAISGSLCGWGDIFIPIFDLVIYIDTPTEIRIQRIEQRELARFGGRILSSGDMYDKHIDFIEWAKTYDTAGVDQRSRALHMEWLKKITCPVVFVDGTKPINELLREVGLCNE